MLQKETSCAHKLVQISFFPLNISKIRSQLPSVKEGHTRQEVNFDFLSFFVPLQTLLELLSTLIGDVSS